MALKVGELYASFNVDTSGVQSALSSIEASFSNIGTQLISIGDSLTQNLTKPLIDFAKSIWTSGSSFSQQMADVKAIAELTEEEFQMLEDLAIEQGSTTVFTATEAAQALEYMATAGWDAEEMYEGLPGVLSLAAASGEDLAMVSDIVTDVMTAFGEPADQVGRFADVLAVAAAATNTDVGKMGYTFKYVAPIAGALGYAIEDVATMIGLMANSGVKGAQAGVALRRMLLNLVNPSQDAFDAMNDLDLYLADGERKLYSARELLENMRTAFSVEEDAPINFFLTYDTETLNPDIYSEEIGAYNRYLEETREYLMAMGEVPAEMMELENTTLKDYARAYQEYLAENEEASDEVSEVFDQYIAAVGRRYGLQGAMIGQLDEYGRIEYASDIAGTYALPGMLAMITATDEEVNELFDAIYNAEGAAEKMAETRLDNAAGDVTILESAIEGLQITLFDLAEEDIRSVIQAVTELVQGFQSLDSETQVTILQAAGVAAALGPVTTVVGTLTTSITNLVPALVSMAGPVGLIMTSLALLSTAAIDSDNSIGEGFESLAGTVSETLDSIDLEAAFQMISDRLPMLSESLRNGINTLLPSLSTFIPHAITELSGAITDNMDSILDLGLDILGGIIDGLANALPSLAASAGDIISSLIQYILTPENWSRILEVGWALVKGIAEGIYYLGKAVLVDAWKVFEQSAEEAQSEAEENIGEKIFTADANSVLRNGIESAEDFYTIADAWRNANSQIDKASYIDFAWLDSAEAFEAVSDVFDTAASIADRQIALDALKEDSDLLSVILPSFGNLLEIAELSMDAAYTFQESNEILNDVPVEGSIVETVEGATAIVEQTTEAVEGLIDAEMLAAQTTQSLSEISAQLGVNANGGIANSLDNNSKAVELSMDSLSEDVVTATMANMSYDSGYSIGWEYTRGISESVASGAVSVLHAAESVLNYNIARNIGVLFSQGIARGIRSGVSSITSAAGYVAQQAVSATKGELDIHSPSRVAERQVGWMWDEGLAAGLLSRVGAVTKAARQVSSSLSESFYVSDPGRGIVGTTRSTVRDIVRETNAQATNSKSNGNSGSIDYDRLAAALRNQPMVMEMDGRVVARVQTKETAMAANARTKAVDLGYGRR